MSATSCGVSEQTTAVTSGLTVKSTLTLAVVELVIVTSGVSLMMTIAPSGGGRAEGTGSSEYSYWFSIRTFVCI